MSNVKYKVKLSNVGTLNVQGCKDKATQKFIFEDTIRYDLQVLGLTETHVKEDTTKSIKIQHGGKTRSYKAYFSGITGNNELSGTGITVEESLKPSFKRISDKISLATIKLNNYHHLSIVTAYVPTLDKSEKDPQFREEFYNELDKVTCQHKKDKHLLLVLGDFNAKTGSGHERFPENIGKFGKGHLNGNGEQLLQYAKENELVLTNTLFNIKLAHRTTWTCLERINPHLTHDGTTRRNPYRNQIDYILTKNIHKIFIQNSRSYGGITVQTDHKLVKATLKLDWYRMKHQKPKTVTYNIDKLRDPEIRKLYSTELDKKLASSKQQNETPNETWSRITTACKETAKTILGLKQQHHKISTSEEIKQLSLQQKKLKNDAESTIDKTKHIELKKQRNLVLKQIKCQLKTESNTKLDEELKDIERYKDDSNKCHQAIRKVNSHKPRKPLAIFNEQNQFIASQTEQLHVITEYFTNCSHQMIQ